MTDPAARPIAPTGALLLASWLALAVPLGGQQTGAGAELFFDTVDVQVVNLEVVVTADGGTPVTGLAAQDFELLVDGEPVPITNFFEVVNRQTVVLGSGPIEEAPEEEVVYLPEPETQRLHLVVIVDDMNLRAETRNVIFERLKEFLWSDFDRRDRFMLAVMGDNEITVHEPFTNDPGLLVQTLGRLQQRVGGSSRIDAQQRMVLRRLQGASLATNPGPTVDRFAQSDFEEAQRVAERLAGDIQQLAEVRFQAVRASLQAMQEFTDTLAGLRGRKAVLYVSDGLPVRAIDPLAQGWLNKYSDWIAQQDVSGLFDEMIQMTSIGTSSRYDASRYFDDLLTRAAINRVAFYPISHGAGAARSHLSPEFAGAGTTSGVGPTSADVAALDQLNREEPLLRMAERTGGVAATKASDVVDLVQQVVADFGTFYSLGYSPPGGIDDEAHDVEVRVKGPGLTVRHLETYQEKAPLDRLQDLTLSALHHGIEDNPLGVRLDPGEAVSTRGKRWRVPVMVKIPFESLLLLPEEDHHTGRVALFVVARDDRGGVSAFQHVEIPIRIPNARIAEALRSAAAYELQLEMRGGHQRIAVGVRDHLAKVDSTINLELDVGPERG